MRRHATPAPGGPPVEKSAASAPAVARGIDSAAAMTLAASAFLGGLRLLRGDASWVARWHAATLDVLVVLAVASVVVAFAAATYRESPRAWVVRVMLLACAAGLVVTAHAVGGGEAGEEGRAHVAWAAGAAAADVRVVAAIHAAALVAAAGALAVAARASSALPVVAPRLARPTRQGLAVGALTVLLTVVAGLSASAEPLPEVVGAQVVHAPWVVRGLVPIEDAYGIRAALLVGGLGLAAIATVPLLDRGERASAWRPAATVLLLALVVAYVAGSAYVSLGPPGHAN